MIFEDINKKKAESGPVIENRGDKKWEPLSGAETVKVSSRIYEILGPELGCRLVEPNIVLLISGLKGHADVPWVRLDSKRNKELEVLNSQLEDFGLEIYHPIKLDQDPKITSLTIVNFKGIERKTTSTTIPGVPHYDSRAGKDGLSYWYWEVNNSLAEAQKAGRIAAEVDLGILMQGIDLGYPDRAIYDFEKCLREGNIHKDLQEADIISSAPEAEKYHGAVPEFDYYPEHENDPEIAGYISSARKVLREYYESDWFKELSQKQEFQRSREEAAEIKKEGLAKKGF